MKETETLDRKRIYDLVGIFMEAIRDNYVKGPVSRGRAYEALNALAATAAVVIKGCDGAEARHTNGSRRRSASNYGETHHDYFRETFPTIPRSMDRWRDEPELPA